jgi:hypothetical protein
MENKALNIIKLVLKAHDNYVEIEKIFVRHLMSIMDFSGIV